MVVIRRLDAVLEPTKEAVLTMKKQLDAAKIANQEAALCPAVKAPVCAVHLGEKQSYWNECEARRARAILAIPGECPIPYGYDVGAL